MAPSSQFPLFDDDPRPGASLVEAVTRNAPADKEQAAFRRLVGKIERQRESLQTWQAYKVRYQQRMAAEMMPAQQAFRQARKDMAFLLDELLAHGPRGKVQRGKLRDMLAGLTQDLLLEETDADLEALHDKHSDISHAEGFDEGLALSQAMVEELFGINLGDGHGACSVEELFAKAEQQLHEHARPICPPCPGSG